MTATTTTALPFVSKAPKLGLVGSFDGLRGMGVCMLLVGHALFGYVESWVTIIDAFFVLSGFLITTLLIQEHRSTKTIDLKKFYQRRADPAPALGDAVRRDLAGHLPHRDHGRLRPAQHPLRRCRCVGGTHVHVPPGLPERAVHDRAHRAVPPHDVAPVDPVGGGVVLHRHRRHGLHLPQAQVDRPARAGHGRRSSSPSASPAGSPTPVSGRTTTA